MFLDDYEMLWVYVASVSICVTMITMILACACWDKPLQKDGWMGVDGSVKITNIEDGVPYGSNGNASGNHNGISHASFLRKSSRSNKKSGNSNRSLPAIPHEERIDPDACSEIYATVEDNKGKLHRLPEQCEDRPTVSQLNAETDSNLLSPQSSLSETPYASVKSEHPYDKLRKTEHPYASVEKATTSNVRASRTSLTNDEPPSSPPTAPPRSRRSSSHNSLVLTNATTVEIAAAVAVAGRIAASQEIPYMTPPPVTSVDFQNAIPTITVQNVTANLTQTQHFSGDSQDSAKGYTSISVREPLANILNAAKLRRNISTDPHYATVSDDSDEMYAAIEDPNQIYGSGSETYAQIQPITEIQIQNQVALINSMQSNATDGPQVPQPPSVDSLRQVAQVHSRQASSSSCTSSVANVNSPKMDKRPVNGSTNVLNTTNTSPLLSRSDQVATVRNLDDMYAKIHKKKKNETELPSNDLHRKIVNDQHMINRMSSASSTSNDRPVSGNSMNSTNPGNLSAMDNSDGEMNSLNDYQSINVNEEHCYETLRSTAPQSPSKRQRKTPNLNSFDCSDYESFYKTSLDTPSDCDPNYEVLRPADSSQKNVASVPLYSTVNRKSKTVENNNDMVVSFNNQTHSNENACGYSAIYDELSGNEPPYERINVNVDEFDNPNVPGYETVRPRKVDEDVSDRL